MLEGGPQHKAKLELRLIGAHSTRNTNTSTTFASNANSASSFYRPSSQQGLQNLQTQVNNTSSRNQQQQCITPKRQISGHNISQGQSQEHNGIQTTPLSAQISSKLQLNNSFVTKNTTVNISNSKYPQSLSTANFARKGKAGSTQIGNQPSSSSLSSGMHGYSLQQDKLTNAKNLNFQKHKSNSSASNTSQQTQNNTTSTGNMHTQHKHQILQFYSSQQQQSQPSSQQQQLSQEPNSPASSSIQNILEIPLSQNSLQGTFSPRVSQRLSGDTPSSHSTTEMKYLKSPMLVKNPSTSASSSYLKGSSIVGSSTVKQGFLSSQSSAGFAQALSKTPKNPATPINSEKSKQLNAQGSFLKKSQLIVTRVNSNTNTSLLNNSDNGNTSTSLIKQSLSRSPLSGVDKENAHAQSTSPVQSDRSSPFSYLQGRQNPSKSPKGSNSVQMNIGNGLGYQSISTHPANFFGQPKPESSSGSHHSGSFLPQNYTSTQHQSSSLYSLQQPGNFFSSQLNRKKNLSQANVDQSEKSQHLSLSPYNRASVTEAANIEASPIPLSGRRAGAGSASGSSSSFLQNSNIKDSIVYKNTNEYVPYQYTALTSANTASTQHSAPRNYLPKSYLSLDAKQKQAFIMNKQIQGGKSDVARGTGETTEANLSFQHEGDDQQMLSMTMFMQGGAGGEEDSNFLNSTNFLNMTGMNPLPHPQSLKHANSCSANTSCILPSSMNPNQQGASYSNNNNAYHHHNSSGSGQANWGNSTVAFNNSTQVFNNSSVCANSLLNTTINTILQNMNTTQQYQAKSPLRNEPILIASNSQTPKLPLDTTPHPANPSADPMPYPQTQEAQRIVLYDMIVPTIRPITRKFRLITQHPNNNAIHSEMMSKPNSNNSYYNDQNYPVPPQPLLQQQQHVSYVTASPSFALSQNSSYGSCQNDVSTTPPKNISNINMNMIPQNNTNTIEMFGDNYLPNVNIQTSPGLEDCSITSNDIFSAGISPSIADSEHTTPVKIHLKFDQQTVSSFEKPDAQNTYNEECFNGAGFALHYTQQYDDNNNLIGQGNVPSAGQQLIPAETQQLQLQQYNFSFSNCGNIFKKQEQLQQSHQQQQQQQRVIPRTEEHMQSAQEEATTFLQGNQEEDVSQNNQLALSPQKPAITMILSEQIPADCISHVSSQMYSPEQGSIASQLSDQSILGNYNNLWSIDSFQLGKCLGRGRFGNVYLARHKPTNMLVAIKQINKKNLIESCMEKQLQQEIKIQTYLNHPNVLKMLGFFDDEQKIHLILELASHGDIYKEIKRESQKKFSEEKAANYIRQICEGLIYLHSQGIIHRDIKPENILNSYGVLKLSDFGWSIYTEEKRMTFCGTLDYVSPEVVSGKDYDFKVDIWSIGVLTYELVTGKPPFENRSNHNEAYQKILQVKYDFPSYLSKESKDFMSRLLVGDPNKRISLEMALNHEWILKNTRNCLADWDSKVSEEVLQLFK